MRRTPAMTARLSIFSLAATNGLLLMLLVLAGCRGTAAATAPTATPGFSGSPGQQIVERARAANLHDATFTITWTGNTTSVPHTGGIRGHAVGKLTTQPYRTDVTFTLTAGTAGHDSYTAEDIADFATNIDYDKTLASTTDLFPVDDKWSKLALNGPIFDLSTSPLLYLHLPHATLVDTNPVRGITVWHVRDTLTDQGHTGVIDAYLRQDTSLPVEMTMHVTTVDTSEDDTILYTAFNTGLSISLPSADQVKSP